MRIPSLDGLRAISFLIFFFLSGYLITTLLRVEYDEHGRISLKNFYLRRMLRIWPPFYIVLFLASAAAFIGWHDAFLGGTIAIAAHVGNYWQIMYGTDS